MQPRDGPSSPPVHSASCERGRSPARLCPGPAITQLALRPGGLASVLTDLQTQRIVSSSPADREIEREIEAEKLKARKKNFNRRRRAARV